MGLCLIGVAIVVGYLLAGLVVHKASSKFFGEDNHIITSLVAWPLLVKVYILVFILGIIDAVAEKIYPRG